MALGIGIHVPRELQRIYHANGGPVGQMAFHNPVVNRGIVGDKPFALQMLFDVGPNFLPAWGVLYLRVANAMHPFCLPRNSIGWLDQPAQRLLTFSHWKGSNGEFHQIRRVVSVAFDVDNNDGLGRPQKVGVSHQRLLCASARPWRS
ncbi:hypothetical protein OF001_U50086 [Pseudomonas sp. OF001]|nr:hypothetical protein OF001_U50086 [Pseudomonas sp. OF001]